MGKVLGLDVGIGSVGWSLIDTDDNKIVDMGVRIFESADASNNQERREARAARRNIRRKKYRLKCIEELLNDYGFTEPKNRDDNPYELRVKGLREKLSEEELYISLYHLAKRRGISYLDEVEDEGKNINDSLKENRELLKTKYPCEIQLERFNNYGKVRGIIEAENKTMVNVFTTESYKKEAIDLLGEQSKYYNQIDQQFIDNYIEILTRKRDFYVGPGDEFNRTNYGIYKTDGRIINSIFEELIGKCSIYTNERRAPVASFTAQEFNILNDLNNLVIAGRKLTQEEKKEIINQVLDSKVKSFASNRMKNIIKKVTDIEDENDIKGFRVDKKGDPEFHTFEVERKIRMFLENTSIDYENFNIEERDKLGEVLSLSKDYKSLKKNFNTEFPQFKEDEINLLFEFLQKNKSLYSRWHSFSLKLMKEMREELYKNPKNQMNILIDKGIRKSVQKCFDGYKYIPVGFLNDEIYNPVVRRSINQGIGIVNAVLKKYGDLEAIVIEMPRETNEKEEKKKIEELQRSNEQEKNEAIIRIRNEYSVTDKQLYAQQGIVTKIRLWYQQDGICIYTGKPISIQDLINKPNMFEVDHIIPKSISLDDSLSNKVLVYEFANQLKGQRTPFNAFSMSSQINYEDIKTRATKLFNSHKINKTKFDLLTFEEDINKYDVRQSFISRNLVDTRYASKAILNGLQEFMNIKGKQTEIHVIRGKFTHQVRKRWGIEKDRDESFAHHGVDATIVAISYMLGHSDGTIRNPFLQRIGKYDKSFWKIKSNDDYDKEVYKLPWEGFIRDLGKATNNIKYSHKIDTKVNRKISDATIYSTREIEGEDYVVKKYKNIYDNAMSKAVIKKIRDDVEKFKDSNDSMILMRKHDPQTFNILLKIISEYEGEKPNPFEAYKKEHGYIRKYSKKGNGPIIMDIKYLANRLGEGIEINKTESISENRRIVLLSLSPFRTDVYYNETTGVYKNIGIKYNDLVFSNRKYTIDIKKYDEIKSELGINEDFKFKFSLHKNDIVGIIYKKNPMKEERYRFLSCKSDNYNRIEVKPIEKNKFDIQNQPTIGSKVLKFNKYHTDILGNIYNVQGEQIKLEFEVDNINDM